MLMGLGLQAKGQDASGAKASTAAKPKTARPRLRLPEWLPRATVMAQLEQVHRAHGIPMGWLIRQFRHTKPQDAALRLINPPPSDGPAPARSVYRVIQRSLNPKLVQDGNRFLRLHAPAFKRAFDQFGVPPRVIAGIIGIETRFGRIMGSFPTLDTLATLGFLNERRSSFFRDEVNALLLLSHEQGLNLAQLKGSFAGALGIPQFMPSSWRRYAIDFDGDGRVQLLQSPADAIGSVANFLREHGWVPGLKTHVGLGTLSDLQDRPEDIGRISVSGLTAEHTVRDIIAVGAIDDTPSLPPDTPASVIALPEPDLGQLYWMATPNFFAITHYNRSYFYAVSVLALSEALSTKGA
jgi:membrane-bound lytic murein transglycosylase B